MSDSNSSLLSSAAGGRSSARARTAASSALPPTLAVVMSAFVLLFKDTVFFDQYLAPFLDPIHIICVMHALPSLGGDDRVLGMLRRAVQWRSEELLTWFNGFAHPLATPSFRLNTRLRELVADITATRVHFSSNVVNRFRETVMVFHMRTRTLEGYRFAELDLVSPETLMPSSQFQSYLRRNGVPDASDPEEWPAVTHMLRKFRMIICFDYRGSLAVETFDCISSDFQFMAGDLPRPEPDNERGEFAWFNLL